MLISKMLKESIKRLEKKEREFWIKWGKRSFRSGESWETRAANLPFLPKIPEEARERRREWFREGVLEAAIEETRNKGDRLEEARDLVRRRGNKYRTSIPPMTKKRADEIKRRLNPDEKQS